MTDTAISEQATSTQTTTDHANSNTAHHTNTANSNTADHTDGAAHADEHHPSDWAYVKIALVLAAVTALEVFTYFRSVLDWGAALVPSLIVMMIVKFYLVATWFMHLRFDSRLFAKMFTAGLVLAVAVYVIALAAFEFWG